MLLSTAAPGQPAATLSTLSRPDGSATYAAPHGYVITGSVNGPIEAQRRDEDPDGAVVDVIVRPAAGVGGTAERNLEYLVKKTLVDLLLVHRFPRCMIQVVLQVQEVPEDVYVQTKLNQPGLDLGLLPALVQTAVLALLDSSLPMRTVATAATVAIDADGKAIVSPSPHDIRAATSVHAFAFTVDGDRVLLNESVGVFSYDQWAAAQETVRQICCRPKEDQVDDSEDNGMALDVDDKTTDGPDLRKVLRDAVQESVEKSQNWRHQEE